MQAVLHRDCLACLLGEAGAVYHAHPPLGFFLKENNSAASP